MGQPKKTDRKWRVTFTAERTVESVGGTDPKKVEEAAREQVLFNDEMPMNRDDITDTTVVWVDDMDVEHLPGCLGNHCRHFGCADDGDIDYREYCSQCDIGAY